MAKLQRRYRYPLGTRVNQDVDAYVRYLARKDGVNVSKTVERILEEHMMAAARAWRAAQQKEASNG
ncbi:hypothetical protein G6L97_04265 [Agrobacterium tumefaciens]|uniref:hypothetical protein n=1 Tax=Agrobacterium tumefaciens TaxID=358 RepID=UPI00122FBB2A|nr:hypothetical protein [Agrobacterium tumefaciens]KAA3531422.1 hypothetical protein DXM29_05550 [Agrobacterium tumefaciens]NSZ83625.1 hypothetical protein [Agrobacterium tumefaciens]WCA69834.1 hypothetical protein G6L97_04265 [Agrobacterium tumefaciens]